MCSLDLRPAKSHQLDWCLLREATASSMAEISSSLSSENVARFVCGSRPLFCRISRTSKEARLSGISTMSMVARNRIKNFQESDLLHEIGANGFSHAVI